MKFNYITKYLRLFFRLIILYVRSYSIRLLKDFSGYSGLLAEFCFQMTPNPSLTPEKSRFAVERHLSQEVYR